MKAHAVRKEDGSIEVLMFECPGCKTFHALHLKENPTANGESWEWNGSLEAPTFSPSLLIRYPASGEWPEIRCHSYIRDGRIEYLSDSTHALSGQTVDMEEWSE